METAYIAIGLWKIRQDGQKVSESKLAIEEGSCLPQTGLP